MRIIDLAAEIGARLRRCVHPSLIDTPEGVRQGLELVRQAIAGVVALALIPSYLLLRRAPAAQELIALALLAAPLVAALVLSRTGSLRLCRGLDAAAIAAAIACAAASPGPLSLAPLLLLAVVPLRALAEAAPERAVLSAAIAVTAAVAVLAAQAAGLIPLPGAWPPTFMLAALALALAATLSGEAVARLTSHPPAASAGSAAAADVSVLDAIDDLVTWHDDNGHVIGASAAATRMLGTSAAALNGRGLLGRVHVSDRPAYLKAISDAAMTDRPVAAQFRLHVGEPTGEEASPKQAQRVIWVEMRAHRANRRGEGRSAAAVVAVTRDGTEHKRRADELELARAKAERADESKGRFLATVSHELRTPLNAIIGFSEILASDALASAEPARRREYATIIRDSGEHLLEVVNALLDMSKIETGNFDFVPEPFDLAALIGGCADLVQLKAEQAGVVLSRQIGRDLPELTADRRACRQILINLLSNAIKFTPAGGLVVLSAQRERDRIVIRVGDTGIGIAAADLPRLGDPFFQAGAAYDRHHEGTGLGLSVVRGLVGLHGGSLTIESAPGEGTTVTIELPTDCRTGGVRATPIPVTTLVRRHDRPPALMTG